MDIDDIPEAVIMEEESNASASPKRLGSGGRVVLFASLFVGFLAVAIGFLIIGSVSRSQAKRGSTHVVIELLPQHSFTGQSDSLDQLWTMQQPDIETEIGKIHSRETLSRVVKHNDLMKEFNSSTDDEAIAFLRQSSSVECLGGNLVKISIHGIDDEKLAAELAESIADGYGRRSVEIARNRTGNLIDELEMQGKAAEKLGEDARDKMVRIIKESDVVDLAGLYDPEILTAMMVRARQDSTTLTPEEKTTLHFERRKLIDAHATKAEFIAIWKYQQWITSKIATAKTAARLPVKIFEIHERAVISNHVPEFRIFDKQSGPQAAWAIPIALFLAMSIYILAITTRRPF